MGKKRKDDITSTGGLSWRDLQDLNNLDPSKIVTMDEIHQNLANKGSFGSMQAYRNVLAGNAEVSGHKEQSSIFANSRGKDYFGNSFFDPDVVVNDNPYTNLNDLRAENQPWISKLTNGIGKGVVLAATTALEGVGLLYGLVGQGPTNVANGKSYLEGLWDNPITRALQSANEFSEEWLPNYYSQREQEDPMSLGIQ